MGLVFSWWLVVEILGLMGMPLTSVVCAYLPDRGWALGKPFALLIVGWLIWFPLSIVTALPFSGAWIVGTFLAFAGLNLLLLRRSDLRADLRRLITTRPVYIAVSEAVFAVGFLLLAWIRSFNPGVWGTEKFMDVAFLSSLVRTQHLPPPDPWLSGAPINYYYFGHFLLAGIAKVLGTQPGTAFNVGIAVIFGLVATAVFGVATNLSAALQADRNLYRALPFGLFSLLLVLVLGNLNGAQIWWQQALQAVKTAAAAGHSGNPWSWWLHRNLWVTYDWWSPSRVIKPPSTINEFPAFSFVLSDLHAHVLALPFDTLAVALALNLLLGHGIGLRVFGRGRIGIGSLVATGIILGSLYCINGWDLPTYLGLVLVALACQQWHAHGRRLNTFFLLDLLVPAVLLIALSVLLYLPFYHNFVSPSQGIGYVPPGDRSPIGDEIAIFGLPLFLICSLLFLWGVRRLAPLLPRHILGPGSRMIPGQRSGEIGEETSATWLSPKVQAALAIGLVLALLVLVTLWSSQAPDWTLLWCLLLVGCCVALAVSYLLPGVAGIEFMERQRAELFMLVLIGTGAALVGACEVVFVRDIFQDRMNTVFKLYYQAWLLFGICGGPALMLLLSGARDWVRRAMAATAPQPSALALAAGGRYLSGVSVLRRIGFATSEDTSDTPDLDVKDLDFVDGDAASGHETSPGRSTLLLELHWAGAAGILVWIGIVVILIGAALIYPVLAASAVTNNFTITAPLHPTLDGTAYMATQQADAPAACQAFAGTDRNDTEAILWLNSHVQGSPVILEAPGCEWSYYSRISAFTGLPTLIGWPGGHEGEWRINWLPEQHQGDILDARAAITNEIYNSPNEGTVLALLRQYHVRYVYVGQLERDLYANANLDRFGKFLHLVYSRDGVNIYAVP
jgi:YYY domain-containing protein